MKVNFNEIIISDRQRQQLEDDDFPIHELASSIRRTGGAVQPPVINTSNELIAGERRVTAYKLLHEAYPNEGWNLIEVVVRDIADPVIMFEMELEENLHRKSLTPQEYHTALLEFHKRKTAANPDGPTRGPQADPTLPERWTVEKTAQTIGKSKGAVSIDLRMAEMLSLLPEEKRQEIYDKAGTSKEAVHREVKLLVERGARQVHAQERVKEYEDEKKAAGESTIREEVKLIDALEGIKQLPDHSIDLCITDPPYGVVEGSAGEKGLGHAVYSDRNFTDNDQSTLDLLTSLAPELFRVLRPGAHLYMFCAIGWDSKVNFHTLCPILASAGFFVRKMPIVWCKDVQGFKPPNTYWPINCEYVIFATTGAMSRDTAVPRADYIVEKPIAGQAKDHRFQKPASLLTHFINRSMVSDGTFLDPFCGSGTSLLAARRKWLRVQGFDLDPEAVTNARQKLGAWDAEVLESNGVEHGMEMLKKVKGPIV